MEGHLGEGSDADELKRENDGEWRVERFIMLGPVACGDRAQQKPWRASTRVATDFGAGR